MSLDLSRFKFSDKPNPYWFYIPQDDGPEIYIFGNSDGPDAPRVEVAEQALPQIERLEKYARGQLHTFFKDSRGEDAWDLLWIQFGKNECDPVEEFALYYHPGRHDAYGLYHATFRLRDIHKSGYLYPINVGREFW
jgi:hypothetical protein